MDRITYTKDTVFPGSTSGVDVYGSGFTADFLKMIALDAGNNKIGITNVRLVGPNQIHADMDVGKDAQTGLAYPRVLIQGVPVYDASNPFSIIRKKEESHPPSAKTPPGPKKTKGAAPKPVVSTTPTGRPEPPKLELHKELIPKNIEIVRCYYSQDIVPPGTTFGFDVNGSGFTSEFEKMIKLDSGHEHVLIKNLHLVTANQIHGDMEVGGEAKTGFVYPRVLIHNLPVFSAPEPFANVRKGEVLAVFFTSMEENGRGGSFRVITNLDNALANTFRVDPSTPGILISDLQFSLPFVVNGHLQIGPGVPPGEHGLAVSIGGKEKYKRIGMIRIVHPNIGQTGFIQGLVAQDKFHRPGDEVQIYVQATGLSAQDISNLDAKVSEFDLGKASFTYLSPIQLRLTFNSPKKTPPGSYGAQIMDKSGQVLYQKKDLFQMVPANWVAGVQVTPPVKAGGASVLKVLGRDFSGAFTASFRIDVDEPGITIGPLQRLDASTMTAAIHVSPGVAPGDYWLHLSANGQKITPPYGSIIKVEAAQ